MMTDDISEFREELINNIRTGAAANMEFDRSAFIQHVVEVLIDSEEIFDFAPCHFEGMAGVNGKKVEIDGWGFDPGDGTFTAFICSYSGSNTMPTLNKPDIDKLVDRVKAFIEGSLEKAVQKNIDESETAYGVALELFNSIEEIERFKIYVIADAIKGTKVKMLDTDSIGGKVTTVCLYDISNLYEIEASKEGYDNIEVSLKDFGVDGIPCIPASADGHASRYDVYLCAIPGQLLSALYEKYGSRLMQSNVRSYLRTKTNVNKGIIATILKEPDMFFAYNNGIAATANNLVIEERKNGSFITDITSLQIVNGGQTTVTIYTVGKSKDNPDLSKISVPMKISMIPPDDAGSVVPNISRFANSQNKVSEADFFSSHPFHAVMEKISRNTRIPIVDGASYATKWYYERVRGQYLQDKAMLTGAELKKFTLENPKKKEANQHFTKLDMARAHITYEGRPYLDIQGYSPREFAATVTKEWGTDGASFNERYFKDSVALIILYRSIKKEIEGQSWYIVGCMAETIAYTMAKLSNMIESARMVLDLQKIWNEQKVSDILKEQTMVIAKEVNRSINEDKEEPNVRSWCKKPKCWAHIRETEIGFVPDFQKCLQSKKHEDYQYKVARSEQRQTNRIGDRIKVVELGPAYWKEAYDWGVDHGVLTSSEKRSLESAFERGERSLPSEIKSTVIIMIRDKLRQSGYHK
jgi:hypothetical protein